jgi:hypothetical protein
MNWGHWIAITNPTNRRGTIRLLIAEPNYIKALTIADDIEDHGNIEDYSSEIRWIETIQK